MDTMLKTHHYNGAFSIRWLQRESASLHYEHINSWSLAQENEAPPI